MKNRTGSITLAALAAASLTSAAAAQGTATLVNLANQSFEATDITFIGIVVDGWAETGPITTEPFPGGAMITGQLQTGLFDNTPVEFAPGMFNAGKPGSSPEPTGMEPFPQAAFIRNTIDPNEPVSLSQNTGAPFRAGATYSLSAAFSKSISAFGPPLPDGAQLELAIGYDVGEGQGFVPVATRVLTGADLDGTVFAPFGTETSMIDPFGEAAGEDIIVRFRPVSDVALAGGTFELDDVQLIEFFDGCSDLDIAAPIGTLDANDLVALLARFDDEDPIADISEPGGTFDATDLMSLLDLLSAGCQTGGPIDF